MHSHSSSVARRKATWGLRGVLWPLLLFVVISLQPSSAGAATPKEKPKGSDAGKQLTGGERKLDKELRGRHKGGAGQSDVIVEFADDLDDTDVVRGFGNAGRRLGIVRGRVLKRVPNALLERLADNPRVRRIHHDRPATADMARTAATIGSLAVVDLMGYTGAGIGVAVIDSGVTNWHDDLRLRGWGQTQPTALTLASTSLALTGQVLPANQRVAHFKDFVGGKTAAYDDWGHGTHVAGIIAGNGYASKGVREGIAPGAHLVALKALDSNGSGTISNIIAAIDYAISVRTQYNIRVINLSLGAGVYESYNTDPLTLAAKRAVEAGIVVVASAGNLGKAKDGSPQYGAIGAPGNAPWVLTVGASNHNGTIDRKDDTVASYSSRGPTMIDFAAKPDLVAPGTGTVSMSAPGSQMYAQKAQYLVDGSISGLTSKPYLTLSGTSMAAPVVSGTVALMLHANPSLKPNMVKAILQYTSQVYPDYDYLTQGAGFLNSRGAVVLAEFFKTGKPGAAYPRMKGWSKHIIWGNRRITGGVLTPNSNAWANNIVWGESKTAAGQNIVWGENCDTKDCNNLVWGSNIVWGEAVSGTNIVWGNTDGDNIVWGTGFLDNIVWGNVANIVWGNYCGGDDCRNIVWSSNIVWGNALNIVWGSNIVWGNALNIVWGQGLLDNIVWGNTIDANVTWGFSGEDTVFGDETAEVNAFDPVTWDELFETAVPEPAAPSAPSPSATVAMLTTPVTKSNDGEFEGGIQ